MKTRLVKYIENFTAKNWKFSDKISDIFHISIQNIDWGYSLETPQQRGGFNEYPHSIFFSRNRKNDVYPCKSQFLLHVYKSVVEGGQNYIGMFSWWHPPSMAWVLVYAFLDSPEAVEGTCD